MAILALQSIIFSCFDSYVVFYVENLLHKNHPATLRGNLTFFVLQMGIDALPLHINYAPGKIVCYSTKKIK